MISVLNFLAILMAIMLCLVVITIIVIGFFCIICALFFDKDNHTKKNKFDKK